MTAPAELEPLITVEDVCKALKVKPDWVYDQVQAKRLKAVRLGRRSLRFRPEDIAAFVESLITGGTEL